MTVDYSDINETADRLTAEANRRDALAQLYREVAKRKKKKLVRWLIVLGSLAVIAALVVGALIGSAHSPDRSPAQDACITYVTPHAAKNPHRPDPAIVCAEMENQDPTGFEDSFGE
jgi:hypothetical protein